MANPLVECIPNFSEGRRPEVIEAIVDAIRNADAVRLLDASSDADHNRSVITFVGAPDAVEKAAFAGIKVAAALINLDEHHGEHPRIGAADVVPLVPLRDSVSVGGLGTSLVSRSTCTKPPPRVRIGRISKTSGVVNMKRYERLSVPTRRECPISVQLRSGPQAPQ